MNSEEGPPPPPGGPVAWPSGPPTPQESPLAPGRPAPDEVGGRGGRPDAGQPAPGWMPPPPAWPADGGPGDRGADDGMPDEESRRPPWIAALVVITVVLASAIWLLTRGPGPATPVADAPTSTAPDDGPTSAVPAPGDAESDEVELDAATVDAHRELFLLIDESERAMIEFILGLPDTELLDDTQREEVAALGEEAASELRELRTRIEDTDAAGRSSPGVTAVREAYLAHLGDWIDWTAAVGDDPGLVTGDGAQPHDDAINDSAAAFVAAVEDALGDRSQLPDDLADLVDLVIERGFSTGGGNDLGEI